jgi:hypothetical protein
LKRAIVLTAMLACAACAGSPAGDREVRLARLQVEHQALIAQIDDLQARLLVDAERVRFWEQMRDRHESVSAIACTSNEAHAIAMAEYLHTHETVAAKAPVARRQARVAAIRAEPEAAAAVRRPHTLTSGTGSAE